MGLLIRVIRTDLAVNGVNETRLTILGGDQLPEGPAKESDERQTELSRAPIRPDRQHWEKTSYCMGLPMRVIRTDLAVNSVNETRLTC